MRLALLCTIACALSMSARAASQPDPWPFWARYEVDSMTSVDHSAWQAFLDRYLATTSDGRTLVRYRAVTAVDRAALDRYLATLSGLDPRTLDRDEQFAFWINLYNALTVAVVLDHPDKDSIRRMGKGLFSIGPWDDELVRIAGRPVTLNDIEHRILRPLWKDRRIHFALNCASVGCPNLAPEAYTPGTLDRLLDAGEQAYLRHPRGVNFRADGTLELSSILDWYATDFAADEAGLLRYLASVRVDIADRLLAYSGKIRYDYDWSLNIAE